MLPHHKVPGGIIHTEQKWTVSPVVTQYRIPKSRLKKKKFITIWPFSLYLLQTSSQFHFNVYWLNSQASPLHDTLILSLRPVGGEHIILYSVRKIQVLMLDWSSLLTWIRNQFSVAMGIGLILWKIHSLGSHVISIRLPLTETYGMDAEKAIHISTEISKYDKGKSIQILGGRSEDISEKWKTEITYRWGASGQV